MIGDDEFESDEESQFLNPCSALCDDKNKEATKKESLMKIKMTVAVQKM